MPELEALCKALSVQHLSFDDITCSIEESIDRVPLLEQEPKLSLENQKQNKILFENNLHACPTKSAPSVIKRGIHTHQFMAAFLEKPLYTITTGFGSPGRGRFIHPHKPRVINAGRQPARRRFLIGIGAKLSN